MWQSSILRHDVQDNSQYIMWRDNPQSSAILKKIAFTTWCDLTILNLQTWWRRLFLLCMLWPLSMVSYPVCCDLLPQFMNHRLWFQSLYSFSSCKINFPVLLLTQYTSTPSIVPFSVHFNLSAVSYLLCYDPPKDFLTLYFWPSSHPLFPTLTALTFFRIFLSWIRWLPSKVS